MFSLQWQNLRKRDQKIPEHKQDRLTLCRSRPTGRDMGLKQDQDRDRNVSLGKNSHPQCQNITEPDGCEDPILVCRLSDSCSVWKVSICFELFDVTSLTLRKTWMGFASVIDFLLSLSIWTAVGLHFPNLFLGDNSPPKRLILLQILNVGTLEKICWRYLLNWRSLGFIPIVFYCPVPSSFTFGLIQLTYSLCSFETFAVY